MKGSIDRDDHRSLRREFTALGLDRQRARSFAGMIASKAPGTADNLVVGLKRLGFPVTEVIDCVDGDLFRVVVITGNKKVLRLVF